MAAGPEVFAVWAYVIAHTQNSTVELNPRLLAAVIGSTPDRMTGAIDRLCAEDPASRSKNDGGRRLIREGEYQYRVPNHEKYRSIRDEDGRREYNRNKQREHRVKLSNRASLTVIDSQSQSTMSAHTEAEAEAEAIKTKAPQKRGAASTLIPKDWNPSESTVEKIKTTFAFKDRHVAAYVAAFRDICEAKGYKYVSFDAAFRNCVQQDWPRLRSKEDR